MRTFIVIILLLWAGITLPAQDNIATVLKAIEKNNTTLRALRETADAEKLKNKTGIFLSNPEVGFNYLWGDPTDIGNRTDISVVQSFDIPTITGMKNRASESQNRLVEWQYLTGRMNILLEAKQCCIDLIYYNALMKELEVRLKHAGIIAGGYRSRMESGDASRLEYNKALLNLSSAQGEVSRIKVERNTLLEQLKRLNGGIEISLDEDQYDDILLPADFESWFAQAAVKNPVLAFAGQEVEAGKQQVLLSKAMGLPCFSAGYMSEKVAGERFQGITLGVSIPLWKNKNRVKQAKVSLSAAELREADSRKQLYDRLMILYNRTEGLKITAVEYRRSLATANSSGLLKKALDAGEISLLDYIVEMGLYYNTVDLALEAERDYQKAFAELSAAEL